MKLNLLYVHSRSIGYGRLGVDLSDQLRKMGVDIYDHLPSPDGDPEADNSGLRTGITKKICWISTPTHATGWWKGQVPSMFTMWEATKLPEQFRENLHNFETVIVPSQQNVELFSQYHNNVKLVPLGIDPDRWHFTPRKMPTTSFRFLLGGSGARKGGDLARRAFRLAFPSQPEGGPMPVLVLKSPKGETEWGGPNIEVVSGRLTDEDEVALYESAHCYVQPSRGEGFGLQPLQAIAQGIPTILTGAHGHAGFAHLGLPLSSTLQPSATFIFGDAGDWWEPDLDELVEYMRGVYFNYESACTMAARSAVEVANNWTWKHTANQFLDALGRDGLEDMAPTEWTLPDSKRYLTILNQNWTVDIAGIRRVFRKGVEYWEPADVKRILFEAGYLDPLCLLPTDDERDLGLSDEQLDELGAYRASAEWCPTCGQKVNSSPTRADEIFAELEAEAKT